MVTVEDLDGAIDVLLFPSAYQLAGTLLAEDAIVTVQGQARRAARTSPRSAARRSPSPTSPTDRTGPVVVSMPITRCTPPVVDQLKEVLAHPPGRDRGAAPAARPRSRPR